MEYKSVTLEQLEEGNPTFCLSAKRALGRCFKCRSYIQKSGRTCPSRIVNKEYDVLMAEMSRKEQELRELKEEINNL